MGDNYLGQITVTVGDEFEVRRPVNLAAGYRWIESNRSCGNIRLVSEEIATGADGESDGIPNVEIMRFQATSPGRCRLELLETRVFVPNEAPKSVYSVEVIVEGKK